MVVAGLEDAAALPLDRVDQPENNMADESNAAAEIFMGSEVKVSKVAQVVAAGAKCQTGSRFVRLIFAFNTNFTIFTTWC
jgi:hypothetical protein